MINSDAIMNVNISPSRIRDYLTCPYFFKKNHIEKSIPFNTSPALSFGISMHGAMDEIYRTDSTNHGDYSAVLRRNWDEKGYSNSDESEKRFEEGVRTLQYFMQAYPKFEGVVLGTEVFLLSRVRLSPELSASLSCKIDLLVADSDGQLNVIDYKTNQSGTLPSEEHLRSDLSTFLYYLLARVNYLNYSKVNVTYINLVSLKKVSVEYDDDQLQKSKADFIACVEEMYMNDFSPARSGFCAYCAVQKECPLFRDQVSIDLID